MTMTMTNDREQPTVAQTLTRFKRRAGKVLFLHVASRALTVCLVAFVFGACLACVHRGSSLSATLAAIGASVLAGVFVAAAAGLTFCVWRFGRRRRLTSWVARSLETSIGNPDLVASAAEWDADQSHPMKRLTTRRAVTVLAGLAPQEVFPLRISQRLALALALAFLAGVIALLLASTEPPSASAPQMAAASPSPASAGGSSPSPSAGGQSPNDGAPSPSGAGNQDGLAEEAAGQFKKHMTQAPPAPQEVAPDAPPQTPPQPGQGGKDKPADEQQEDPPPTPLSLPDDPTFVPKRVSAKVNKGEYLFEIAEVETKRRSKETYKDVFLRYERRALDLVSQDRVPPEYRQTVRAYFGKLNPAGQP